jgi:hypothetical protein
MKSKGMDYCDANKSDHQILRSTPRLDKGRSTILPEQS